MVEPQPSASFSCDQCNRTFKSKAGFVVTNALLSGNFRFASSLAPGSAPFVNGGSGVLAAFRCIGVFQLLMLPSRPFSLSSQILHV